MDDDGAFIRMDVFIQLDDGWWGIHHFVIEIRWISLAIFLGYCTKWWYHGDNWQQPFSPVYRTSNSMVQTVGHRPWDDGHGPTTTGETCQLGEHPQVFMDGPHDLWLLEVREASWGLSVRWDWIFGGLVQGETHPRLLSSFIWLVVGPPLWKNMNVSWDDDYSQYFWENKIDGNQTTNQLSKKWGSWGLVFWSAGCNPSLASDYDNQWQPTPLGGRMIWEREIVAGLVP